MEQNRTLNAAVLKEQLWRATHTLSHENLHHYKMTNSDILQHIKDFAKIEMTITERMSDFCRKICCCDHGFEDKDYVPLKTGKTDRCDSSEERAKGDRGSIAEESVDSPWKPSSWTDNERALAAILQDSPGARKQGSLSASHAASLSASNQGSPRAKRESCLLEPGDDGSLAANRKESRPYAGRKGDPRGAMRRINNCCIAICLCSHRALEDTGGETVKVAPTDSVERASNERGLKTGAQGIQGGPSKESLEVSAEGNQGATTEGCTDTTCGKIVGTNKEDTMDTSHESSPGVNNEEGMGASEGDSVIVSHGGNPITSDKHTMGASDALDLDASGTGAKRSYPHLWPKVIILNQDDSPISRNDNKPLANNNLGIGGRFKKRVSDEVGGLYAIEEVSNQSSDDASNDDEAACELLAQAGRHTPEKTESKVKTSGFARKWRLGLSVLGRQLVSNDGSEGGTNKRRTRARRNKGDLRVRHGKVRQPTATAGLSEKRNIFTKFLSKCH